MKLLTVEQLLKFADTFRFRCQHQYVLHVRQGREIAQSVVGFDSIEMVDDPAVWETSTIGLLPDSEVFGHSTISRLRMVWSMQECIPFMVYAFCPRSRKVGSHTSHVATVVGAISAPSTLRQDEGLLAPEAYGSSPWVGLLCELRGLLPRGIVWAKLLVCPIRAGIGAKFRSAEPSYLSATEKHLATVVTDCLDQLSLAHSVVYHSLGIVSSMECLNCFSCGYSKC